MKLRIFSKLLIILGWFSCPSLAVAVPMTEFQLNVRADTVLSIENRLTVLSVAERILNRNDPQFAELMGDLPNPFLYESRPAPVEAEFVAPAPEPEPRFSEQEVLAQIAATLSSRITGSLERGGNYFVQLSGGELLRVGNRLPVRIPTLSAEAFIIEIISISPSGLMLGLGESRIALPMPTGARGGARLTPADEAAPNREP
jgi:hypothetical protein